LVYLLAMSVLFVWWMEPSRGSDGHSEPNVRSLPSPSRGQVIDRDGRSLASLGMTLLLVHAVSCSRATPAAVAGGDATRGKQALAAMGCGACHTIDGVASAHGQVGPPLDGIARRSIIAGELPNTPENMMRWIENPQAVEPTTAMPNLGVTPQSARDMTAYLYTLR
jgi:cytochrome c2